MKKYIFVFVAALFTPLLAMAQNNMMNFGSLASGAEIMGNNWSHGDYMMNGWGMMGGMSSIFSWLALVTWVVWLIVGFLAIILIWKNIRKK